MNIYIKCITTFLYSCLLLGWCGSIHAQEFLTGLHTDVQVVKEAQKYKGHLLNSKTEKAPLMLPFFEDFSNYTGYPNENLFMDKQAFVNKTYPVFPVTVGVLTLDALNEYGQIYSHLNATPKGADTLTSHLIRLDSLFVGETERKITLTDSLYFSFYFQPGGAGITGASVGDRIGNQPDAGDSLVLEFGYTRAEDELMTWEHVWSTPGFNVNIWTSENPYLYFKQVLIPITNEKYLCDNFQFRFRNYASLEPQQGIEGWEGNVDQWHIDYIRLDINRTANDIYTNDLAFVSQTTSLLKNYQAMPWKQFKNTGTETDVKTNFTNQLTNLAASSRTSTYQYSITQNGNMVGSYSVDAIDIDPYVEYGIQEKASQASPPVDFLLKNLTDTASFVITHLFQNRAGLDMYPQNDTCVFKQKFYNYYAYDDGTAEYGYCLNNQFNIALLGMKFSLRVPDTLTAVRMYFNHTKKDENANAVFSIVIWKDDNGQPGEQLYSLEENKPQFFEQYLDFIEYKLSEKILVSGDIWIGFAQQGNIQLNIGFDQNNDSREFFKYKTGATWETSVYRGTPMIRPVFGELTILNINEIQHPHTAVVPNPAHDYLQITNDELPITKVEIYNILGVKVDEKNCNNNTVQMNVATFPAGIYFVRIYKENNAPEVIKLIKN